MYMRVVNILENKKSLGLRITSTSRYSMRPSLFNLMLKRFAFKIFRVRMFRHFRPSHDEQKESRKIGRENPCKQKFVSSALLDYASVLKF